MKSITLLIIGISFSLISFSQWNPQISNTTFNLNDVFFTSDNVGFAVGDNGRITKTVDGGSNWTASNAIPTCNLNSVFFSSPDSAWIASTCGIHFTSDGGLNWSLQTIGNGEELNDVFFSNSQIGWAVGNKMTIMRTIDGGNNWVIDTLTSNIPNNPLLTVYFRDATNGWIGGGERLHFTTDGGQNWIHGSSLLAEWIYAIDFGDEYAGVASGMAGSTTNTFDWGINWSFNGSVTPNHQAIHGVNFSSKDSVYMVGQSGLIYFSANSGSTWNTQTSGTTETLKSVYFPSKNIGYAVGNAGVIIKYGQSLSVNNFNSLEQFKAYPNPVNEILNIELNELQGNPIKSIKITNSLGKEIIVLTKFFHDKIQIDTGALSKGVYILEIERENNSPFTKRIIKN